MRSWLSRWRHEAPSGGASSGDEPDDRDLVLQYQRDPQGAAGRRAAAQLVARYQRRVLAWCWRLVGDRDTALDLAQDTLLTVWRRLDEYDERGKFGAWVFMVARNRCLSELRRRKVPLAGEAVLELVADPGPRPDAVLERRLLGEDLERLLAQHLTPLEQDALWLRCYEGLPVEVITRRLGLVEKAGARTVLQRARRKLRAALRVSEGDAS
ncbi:MAG: sigma-70 family RNA polymerase sigma factor [Candidatus Krumholzibacteriia bacterium]